MKLISLFDDLFRINLTRYKESILLIIPSGIFQYKIIILNKECSSVEKLLGSSLFFQNRSQIFFWRLIVLIC